MKGRLLLWFLLAQVLLCGFIFRGGLWGASILAPVDIAPAFFPHYRYLEPSSSGVPANHWIIDQLTYDLPLQLTIYKSIRRGEMPWWDPYNYCGRPLLADAAVTGTDPIRLLTYVLLSFEAAYNWTTILHFIFSGLGMLLLINHFGFRNWFSLGLALTFEFAGCFTIYCGHPMVQGAFLYYPFLWLVWDKAFLNGKKWCFAVAPLLVAAIFYCGNTQLHSYVVVFALAFGLGYAGWDWPSWKKVLPLLAWSGLVGGCIAAPVVFNQIELFLIGIHRAGEIFNRFSSLQGIASFSAVYPWVLGTFRTLDASKFFAQPQPLGFSLFIGSSAFLLSVLGAVSRTQFLGRSPVRRTAFWLCGLYFLIASTPLVRVLYLRCAPLAVMGLIVLAAFGLEEALQRKDLPVRFGRLALGLTLFLALATNLAAWMIYPRLIPKVRAYVQSHKSGGLEEVPALRRFQVESLPAEISFQNPETILACLGMLGVGLFILKPALRKREPLWMGLLLVNLLPVLLYAHRYLPCQPMSQWQRLLAGGPEQQKIMTLMRGTPWRLLEPEAGQFGHVFPLAMSHLYEVRTVHGYSSMRPHSLFVLPSDKQIFFKPQLADWIYESGVGALTLNPTPGLARFQWLDATNRSFNVEQIDLNSLRVSFAPGAAGALLWTDTFYPGWQGRIDGTTTELTHADPCFTKIDIPGSAKVLILRYQPRFLLTGQILACIGLALIAVICFIWSFRHNIGLREATNRASLPKV